MQRQQTQGAPQTNPSSSSEQTYTKCLEDVEIGYSTLLKNISNVIRDQNVSESSLEELKKNFENFENNCDNMYLYLTNVKQDVITSMIKKQSSGSNN